MLTPEQVQVLKVLDRGNWMYCRQITEALCSRYTAGQSQSVVATLRNLRNGGLVASHYSRAANLEQWYITPAGREALEEEASA
jgi:DNA-binding PadR family transcriptional regulator